MALCFVAVSAYGGRAMLLRFGAVPAYGRRAMVLRAAGVSAYLVVDCRSLSIELWSTLITSRTCRYPAARITQ
eukprot:2363653-Rhodomonas_salina.2